MSRVATNLSRETRFAVGKAALLVKTSVQRELGGTKVLRGVGRRGARIGVRYDVKGGQQAAALVRMTGPAHLIERSTRPHTIEPRRRRRGGQALRLADGSFAASVQHPGTRGKHPWEKGVERSLPLVRESIRRSTLSTLRGTFR